MCAGNTLLSVQQLADMEVRDNPGLGPSYFAPHHGATIHHALGMFHHAAGFGQQPLVHLVGIVLGSELRLGLQLRLRLRMWQVDMTVAGGCG